MNDRIRTRIVLIAVLSLVVVSAAIGVAQVTRERTWPEQRCMEIRDPSQLCRARIPHVPTPATVSAERPGLQEWHLSLDEAIRIALANSEVIRVLGGSSGRTIYDPAVTNTQVDQARARFEPSVQVLNTWNRSDFPGASFNIPGDPTSGVRIDGTPVHDYNLSAGLSKTTRNGGIAGMTVNANPTHTSAAGLPLNPQNPSSVDMSYVQPLLQGGGVRVNMAPIAISRIDTERSFFQTKDAVQRLVSGTIDAYWGLVFARTDHWARQQQRDQTRFAFDRATARSPDFDNVAQVAQTESAYESFRASEISSRANVFRQEALLRNIMGLPPSSNRRIVPVTPPATDRKLVDWPNLIALAEQRRPDLIELKLILEADQQRLLQAENDALPQVDATALYRWNGLDGRTPDGAFMATGSGRFTGWQLGVNFSVPLGLRQARATLRQQELVLVRDRANLQQGLHDVTHVLADNYRNLAEFYEQYVAYTANRKAARTNLSRQNEAFETGLVEWLNVLQAINEWGNSVSAQAQALVQYNTELANLERETGTILEMHGVQFTEEYFFAIGPMGRLGGDRLYPRDMRPGPNVDQYPVTSQPAERAFNLERPVRERNAPMPPAPNGPRLPPPGAKPIPPVGQGNAVRPDSRTVLRLTPPDGPHVRR